MKIRYNDIQGDLTKDAKGFIVEDYALTPDQIWTKYGLKQLINQLQSVVDKMEDA